MVGPSGFRSSCPLKNGLFQAVPMASGYVAKITETLTVGVSDHSNYRAIYRGRQTDIKPATFMAGVKPVLLNKDMNHL